MGRRNVDTTTSSRALGRSPPPSINARAGAWMSCPPRQRPICFFATRRRRARPPASHHDEASRHLVEALRHVLADLVLDRHPADWQTLRSRDRITCSSFGRLFECLAAALRAASVRSVLSAGLVFFGLRPRLACSVRHRLQREPSRLSDALGAAAILARGAHLRTNLFRLGCAGRRVVRSPGLISVALRRWAAAWALARARGINA